jgi:hypothetical protein
MSTWIHHLFNKINHHRSSWKRVEGVFTKFYHKNFWGGESSASGTGSDAEQTRVVAARLPELLQRLEVACLLDIPCGDFHWMSRVELGRVRYLGADIVRPIIEGNRKRYGRPGREFLHLNLISDILPEADLVFCRDCLVHLSYADIDRALKNVVRSGARYFATTTFPSRKENRDIQTGDWRVLNLEAPPFCLPKPLDLINEECTEVGGIYSDKSLALWSTESLKPSKSA